MHVVKKSLLIFSCMFVKCFDVANTNKNELLKQHQSELTEELMLTLSNRDRSVDNNQVRMSLLNNDHDVLNLYTLIERMLLLEIEKEMQREYSWFLDRNILALINSIRGLERNIMLDGTHTESAIPANIHSVYTKRNDITHLDQPARFQVSSRRRDPRQYTMMYEEDSLCNTICTVCKRVLSKRWSAFCDIQCYSGGREYDACVVVWKYIH